MAPFNEEAKPFLTESSDHHVRQQPIRHANHHQHGDWKRPAQQHSTAFWLMTHALTCLITSFIWLAILCLTKSTMSTWMCSDLSASKAHSHHHTDLSTDVSHNFTAGAHLITCGNSTEEAKSMGCKYDILSNHWVPGVCMDEEAVKEYQKDDSWHGYADKNKTELLSYETMGDRDVYYTSMRDHIVHCAVLWKKQFRAFYVERRNIDTLIASYHHTMHCAQFLIDMTDKGTDFRKQPIAVDVGWAGCWIRD